MAEVVLYPINPLLYANKPFRNPRRGRFQPRLRPVGATRRRVVLTGRRVGPYGPEAAILIVLSAV